MQNTTEQASKVFAELADKLASRGFEKQELQRYLSRVAFYLFAEHVGVLPSKPLSFILQHSRNDAPLANECISLLFALTTKQ